MYVEFVSVGHSHLIASVYICSEDVSSHSSVGKSESLMAGVSISCESPDGAHVDLSAGEVTWVDSNVAIICDLVRSGLLALPSHPKGPYVT